MGTEEGLDKSDSIQGLVSSALTDHVTSLYLHVLIYRMGTVVIPVSQTVVRISQLMYMKHVEQCSAHDKHCKC